MPNRYARLVVALCSVALLVGAGGVLSTASAARPAKHKLHLLKRHYLTVGTDASYPPMESYNSSIGQYVGADIGLAKALAHAMGLRGAKIVNNTFTTIIPAMKDRHKFDVIMSSMYDTAARRKVISFVDYMKAREAIVVLKSSGIHADSYTGMCGKTVAVESGTVELDGLNKANKTCSSKINIKSYSLDTDAFNAFSSGHADAYTGDLPVARYYVNQHSSAIRLAGKPFAGENYAIGLGKHRPALKHALKHALHHIMKTGKYYKILKKWGVQSGALKK